MFYNKIGGHIPSSIGNLNTLRDIFLDGNLLTGEIPSSIGNLRNMISISMSDNQLSGQIPLSLGNCGRLTVIQLSKNQLIGSIPSSFKKLKDLKEVLLNNNLLSGELKDVFAKECPLINLDIGNNKFSGFIPAFLSRFTSLYELNLGNNHFSGRIPSELGNLTHMQTLILSQNQLAGGIPKTFSNFSIQGVVIFLNDNQLSEIYNPQYVGNPPKDGYAYVQNNKFTFSGLEYLAAKYKYLTDAPQANISIHHYQHKLVVSAGGTLSNNTYTWFPVGKGSGHVVIGDSTFTPTESGSYYCSVTNKIVTNLTLHTDTVTFITDPIVKNELTISISPNPARGMISIYGFDEKSDAKITIADMSGYVWMNVMSREKTSLQIDVSRLKAGNYLVNVNDGKVVKTVMFVKE